jgi:hypothetical protein
MKNLGRFLVVFTLLCIPAVAQDKDLTLFGGVHFPGKITLENANTGVSQILDDPANLGVFGLRFGRAKVFGHEETFAYVPNFLDSDSKAVILNSNLLVQAPFPVLKPYATAGLGSVISWGSGIADLGTKFAVNYGGGVKVRPAGPVGVRLDARGYSIFGVQSQTLRIYEVSVGVLFSF